MNPTFFQLRIGQQQTFEFAVYIIANPQCFVKYFFERWCCIVSIEKMNKLILVTGAGRGLGRAVSELHLSRGDRVFACDIDETDELKELKARYPDSLRAYKCDVGDTESVNAAMSELLSGGGMLDVLYHSAAMYRHEEGACGGLRDIDIDAGMAMYNVNGTGIIRVCKAVWPLLGRGSVVVNVTSEAGGITNCYRKSEYLYCMSKAAANMAGKLLSNELQGAGARVICVHPGWLKTRMGGERAAAADTSITPEKSAEDIAAIVDRIGSIPPDQLYIQHDGSFLPW